MNKIKHFGWSAILYAVGGVFAWWATFQTPSNSMYEVFFGLGAVIFSLAFMVVIGAVVTFSIVEYEIRRDGKS